MEKYIYHHLGLGDHLVCHGLVRELTKDKNNTYTLFVYEHNKESVAFMFKDIGNLKFISVNSDNDVYSFLSSNNISDSNIHSAGIVWKSNWGNGKSFEECFYNQNNLNLNLKWDNFKVNRDYHKELELFNKLGIDRNSDYIFVHEDERFKLDYSKINTDLKKIIPVKGLTNNIFDYCGIIENAKEVHVLESSFCFMIDLLNLNSYVYAHRYPRWQNEFGIPKYKNIKECIL
jgi:hypothetical protein